MSLFWVVLLTRVGLSIAPNPLADFCRLHGHRTAVVDRKLYIDSGFINWAPITADPANKTNTWLRVGDFDTPHLGFPNQTILAKNAAAPSVSGGVLWPDTVNKIIYAYGGEQENIDTADKRLWFYDILYDTWNVSITNSIASVSPAAWGAGATASDKALGYYYGGWPTNTSHADSDATNALATMVVYNMLDNKFSTHPGPDQIGRAEGVMLYVPAGDSGLLLYFGGVQVVNGTRQPLPMSDIFVYDIANVKWYKQTASGVELPASRRRFCAGAAWAGDSSSYNIYLYGGASIGEGIGYGDVWILTLPSFTWIKFSPTPDDKAETSPRHSLTCDVYENSQMIVMGGYFANDNNCDTPSMYGQHGLYLGRSNVDGSKWTALNTSLTTYEVPSEVTNIIGGNLSGNAAVSAPKDGWENTELGEVFQRKHTPASRNPTRPITTPATTGLSGAKHSLVGPAVGGTLGGVLFLIALALALFLVSKHRRRRRIQHATHLHPHNTHPTQPTPHAQLPSPRLQHYSSPFLARPDPNSPLYPPHYTTTTTLTASPAQETGTHTDTDQYDAHTPHAWGMNELGDEKQQRLLVPAHELSSVRSPRPSPRHSLRRSKVKEGDGLMGE
ncbi:hypothetical protein M3J09_004261 [Ascochyta lentis]